MLREYYKYKVNLIIFVEILSCWISINDYDLKTVRNAPYEMKIWGNMNGKE